MELVPVAQAVTTSIFFPLSPYMMLTFPDAMFEIIRGTKSGATLPLPYSRSLECSLSRVWRLPTPLPIAQPALKGSSELISSPASSMASLAAATANCENLSILLAIFLSMKSSGSKSFTSAASFTLYSSVSKAVMGAKPVFSSFTDLQNSSTPMPMGVTAPIPVTTTLLLLISPFLHPRRAPAP